MASFHPDGRGQEVDAEAASGTDRAPLLRAPTTGRWSQWVSPRATAEEADADAGDQRASRVPAALGMAALVALLISGTALAAAMLQHREGCTQLGESLNLCWPSPERNLLLFGPGSTTTTTRTITRTLTTTSTKTTSRTTTTVTNTTTTTTVATDSLFCFALVMPEGYEVGMIKWLHKKQKSLFLCEKHAIYSNVTLDLPGLHNSIVKTSLYAPIGGQWYTALNTPIFQKLWVQVIDDGVYKQTAWTVKLDVDAVFLPGRLQELVRGDDYKDAQGGAGHFLNNCEVKGSLHGPIEVLSRKALEVYGEHYEGCDQSWQQEDVFMRMCLVSIGVNQHYDWVVMSEQYCNDDWESCTSRHITFHPFKSIDTYEKCLADAESSGNWWL